MNDCCDDTAFWEQRLAAKKAAIVAYEAAITAVAGGAHILRVHDVAAVRRAVTVAEAIRDAG